MPACHVAVKTANLQPGTGNDWIMSRNKHSRANIIVWGLHKVLSTLEVRSIFADLVLGSFVRGKVYWEGNHVRLLLTSKDSKDSKGISKELVREVSSVLTRLDTTACSSELDRVNRFQHCMWKIVAFMMMERRMIVCMYIVKLVI